MSQEKPYRLTFYESGYIIPEKFETLEYKDFATDCCGLKPVLYETDMDSKAIDKMLGVDTPIQRHGCMGIPPKD
jgi:hypothetical protein